MQAFADTRRLKVHVIFAPAKIDEDGTPWWFRLWYRWRAEPGYGHVIAAWQDDGHWIIIDPQHGRLIVRRLSESYTISDILRMHPHTEVLVTSVIPALAKRRNRGILTCVSVIKALLGLDGRSITPWQLREQILRSPIQ